MSVGSKRVVVVGGGVIGAACAYYLRQANWEVTVVERDRFGRACSHGNCGLVSPSHALPLAIPGAVGDGFRSMLKGGNSPLSVRPTLNPARLSWFYQFARRCNHRDMLQAGAVRNALLRSSFSLYEKLLADEGLTCEWQKQGGLFVFSDEKKFHHWKETADLLHNEFDLTAVPYEGDAVSEFEPTLRDGLAGGWFYEVDAHLRPDLLMASWRDRLKEMGVVIREECEVKGLSSQQGAATLVETSTGEFEADAFVFAAGAETPHLANCLGWKAPIQPGKGYSITMSPPDAIPRMPLHFHERKVVATPMGEVFRLGSTMEFAGYDRSMNDARLQALRDGAEPYLRDPTFNKTDEKWWGWRPMTVDGVPFIGPAPKLSNVFVAAGHNMLGLSMGPATGKLIAEMITGETPHLNVEAYALNR